MDAIRLVCPECDAVHRVKNITLGKLYRCKKCKSGLITMQPAVLTCPACGATRPPAHIEVSRLVTCDECEQMPLMNLRISGVTFSSNIGDQLSATAEKPEPEAAAPLSEIDPAAAIAETSGKSAPAAPELASAMLAAPPAAASKAEIITVVEPLFAEEARPQSATVIRDFRREADAAENNAQRRAAKNSASTRLFAGESSTPAPPAARGDTSAILPAAASPALTREPPPVGNDRETPAARDPDNVDFYDDAPPAAAPIVSAPTWSKSLLNDVAELKTLLRTRKLSVFARPVFGWICLALLILLYGYALAVNTAQESQLQNARRQLSQLAAQAQKDYDEMKDLLTRRIADLEKERTALRGEKVALENDLRDYYNKLGEAQRKINLLNKAYSLGVDPGAANER